MNREWTPLLPVAALPSQRASCPLPVFVLNSAVNKYDPPTDYEYQLVQSLVYARSFETETVLAMCNAGGDEPRGFMGGSGIWQPFKGKLRGSPISLPTEDATTDLQQYVIDLGILPVARKTYKIREDWEAEQR